MFDEAVDVATFVANVEGIAESLPSILILDRTKIASEDPGECPSIEIKAGKPQEDKEFFDFKHRAAFTLLIEDAVQPSRCYFLLSVNARSHPQDDPATEDTGAI